MEDSKNLFWSSKFPWAHRKISSKFRGNLGTRPRNGTPALDWTNQVRMESRRRAGSTLRIREVPCSNLTPKTEHPEALHGCIRYLHANSGTVLSTCIFRFCQRRHIRRDVYFFTVGLNVAFLVTVAHILHRMSLNKGEIKAKVIPNNRRHFESILSTANINFFGVLLTVHLSITLVNDQHDAQFLYFIICLLQSYTCFEQRRAHHQEVKLY